MVVDGNVLLQVTLVDQADSAAAEETVEQLRTDLDAVSTDALVGGTTAIQLDTKTASQRDLRVIIPAVLLVTLIVLILLLRAIVAPLVLIATVVRVVRGDHRAGGDRLLPGPGPARAPMPPCRCSPSCSWPHWGWTTTSS